MRSSVVLPAPFGPSRPGDAAVEGEVDVGEGAGAAVALADAGELDGARRPLTTPPPAAGRRRPGSR